MIRASWTACRSEIGDQGDEQADPRRRQDEQSEGQEDMLGWSKGWHAEADHEQAEHDGRDEHAEGRERKILADQQLGGPDRRDPEQIHRTALSVLQDGE